MRVKIVHRAKTGYEDNAYKVLSTAYQSIRFSSTLTTLLLMNKNKPTTKEVKGKRACSVSEKS